MKQRKLMRKVKPGEHRLTFSVSDEEYAAIRQNARDMGFDSPEKWAAFAFRFPVKESTVCVLPTLRTAAAAVAGIPIDAEEYTVQHMPQPVYSFSDFREEWN